MHFGFSTHHQLKKHGGNFCHNALKPATFETCCYLRLYTCACKYITEDIKLFIN